jgi:hypothetical protein
MASTILHIISLSQAVTQDRQQREWDNAGRQSVVPAPPYHVPPSRQEHILQQLSAIKEVSLVFFHLPVYQFCFPL